MEKWDYKIVTLRGPDSREVEERLKELGDQGWELVTVVDNTTPYIRVYLKKRKP